MNLYKIDYIFHEADLESHRFATENCMWTCDISSYPNKYGITINHKYCVEYMDGQSFINIDKMKVQKDIILKKTKFSYTNEDIDNMMIFIALNGEYVIPYFENDQIKEMYEIYNKNNYVKCSMNEWIIKGLLE